MLGYYHVVNHSECRITPGVAFTIVLSLYLLVSACQSPAASLAIMDPVFAYLSPDSIKTYSSAARDLALLPDADASAALYAVIDAQAPVTVFLSPLLAQEIDPILARNEQTRIVYLGNVQPKTSSRLYAAVFSSMDAASQGGRLAAAEAIRLDAEQQAGKIQTGVAAIFAGLSEAEACSEAFMVAYRTAGGPGEPLVEVSIQGFSQVVADRLASLDLRVGYLAAPPHDAERWARQGFDQSTYILMEYALPSQQTTSLADAFIAWDIAGTMSSLVEKLSAEVSGIEKGHWKTVLNEQRAGNRR